MTSAEKAEKVKTLKTTNQELLMAAKALNEAAYNLPPHAAPERQKTLRSHLTQCARLCSLNAARAMLEVAVLSGDTDAVLERQTVALYSRPTAQELTGIYGAHA